MMQSNIFARVVPLLKEQKSNIDCDAAIEFLGRYRSGQWIYPSALHKSLRMKIIDVYEVLELCSEVGLIEPYLEIYCPHCQRFTGYFYKTLMDIPEELNCIHCDSEIHNPENHAIVIYQVK